MYAIRSYYGFHSLDAVGYSRQFRHGNEDRSLREPMVPKMVQQLEGAEGVEPFMEPVITSYSIHYTKLYDRYSGETLVYYSNRNKYRMEPYHRLDISLTFDENLRRKRMWKGSWTFSIYNVYGRNNPYSVYYRKTVGASGSKDYVITSYSIHYTKLYDFAGFVKV